MRSAVVHVLADAGVSVLVIVGLLLGDSSGLAWMDPVVGLVGAIVIAVWSYTLIRDTGAILLDINPDRGMAERMRAMIETDGDRLTDLHLWRLGPGHLGAIVSVATERPRGPDYYQSLLRRFRALSHVTVQVNSDNAAKRLERASRRYFSDLPLAVLNCFNLKTKTIDSTATIVIVALPRVELEIQTRRRVYTFERF